MRLIGLMSGTSVDSIDAACVEIDGTPGQHSITLISFVSHPWPEGLRSLILNVCRADAPLQHITVLNFMVGEAFADAAIAAARSADWSISNVAAIASHGQTIWHQPNPISVGIGYGMAAGTLQIGEPCVIAARTGCTVVADFRTADMAVGGQGAPLVPFADYSLLASLSETRAVQNIGGIANVTYLRANGGLDDIIAFDTGPGNMLVDELSMMLTGQSFDEGGGMAAQGEVCGPLLERLLANPFFQLAPPRTTGRETFGRTAARTLLSDANRLRLSDYDILATATALTAESIANAYQQFLNPIEPIECVVLGGGGVQNATLVSRLTHSLSPARVTTHEEFGIRGDAKEAIAFALIAYESLHGRPSNIPSATGARSRAVLGKIVHPYAGANSYLADLRGPYHIA